MRKVIRNVKYFDEKNQEVHGDVYIEDGKFTKPFITDQEDDEILLDGQWLFPSFVDLHVHLRTPGFEAKEDLVSGTKAAAHGGYTTVCCMPNTNPCLDKADTIKMLNERIEQEAIIEVLPFGAITIGSKSKELTDHEALIAEGCIGLSDDGKTTMDVELMKEALRFSHKAKVLVSTHSEDHSVEVDKHHAAPRMIENSIVERDIDLLAQVGGNLHVGHLSTREGLEAVRRAKARELKVTCEVTPHHLLLASENIEEVNAKYKVNPPIRRLDDNKALIEGINDGTIDVIATDHAPHEMTLKTGLYSDGAFGFTGIELAFSSLYTHLVKTEKVSLQRLIEMMSHNPRKLIGREPIKVAPGYEASFTIIDLDMEWKISKDTLKSKGKNTPFDGQMVYGVIQRTVWQGREVYTKEELSC